ncbi:hypothetical protein LXJ15735_33260 [Lacrimispora xylanolytica]
MKRWLLAVIVCSLVASGCSRYKKVTESEETESSRKEVEESAVKVSAQPGKKPVKVKGIYISGYMAGSEGMEAILDKIKGTEINTIVIDVKNDDGRITFAMDGAPTVQEIGAEERCIKDMDALMKELKSRGLYTIARVVAFRDPYLAEKKPEWGLKNQDGSLHRDNKGLPWVNPYRQEVWDYLVEVGTQASVAGFDEVQFDYIRFATDSSMNQVVFDEKDTRGRSKTDVITEFIEYAYKKLSAHDIYVSADVFGAIIGSNVDAQRVGQVYYDMAEHLDYICPMIYPSHYSDGNFNIDHPDTEPYNTVLAALELSKKELLENRKEGRKQAVVRPWLQDFTASYLDHYIPYGPKEVRAQIQAVYDAGYDEWILWSASNRYTWEGLLTKEEGEKEQKELERLRQSASASQAETSKAYESLEGKVAEEEPTSESSEDKKTNVRKKPNVVIVTTGGSRN